MHEDIRAMNTPSLISIVEDSSKQGFNRTVEPEWVKQNADPGGMHVAALMVDYHQPAREMPPHHRVQMLMKVKDTTTPVIFMLDISVNHWSWLYTVEEWQAMVEEAQKPEPDFMKIAEKFGRVKYVKA